MTKRLMTVHFILCTVYWIYVVVGQVSIKYDVLLIAWLTSSISILFFIVKKPLQWNYSSAHFI